MFVERLNIDNKILNEESSIFYGVYRPIRFYHTTPNCKILKKYISLLKKDKEIKELNLPLYEIEQFESKENAIKNGYLFPCPLCAFSVSSIFKFKTNEGYIQIPLDGLDILILFYINNILEFKNKLPQLKDIKINISIKIIKSAIKNLKKLKVLDNTSDGYKLTQIGKSIMIQIKNEISNIPDNIVIEKVFEQYLSKYKLFRRIQDYEKYKEKRINIKEEFHKLQEIRKQNNT